MEDCYRKYTKPTEAVSINDLLYVGNPAEAPRPATVADIQRILKTTLSYAADWSIDIFKGDAVRSWDLPEERLRDSGLTLAAGQCCRAVRVLRRYAPWAVGHAPSARREEVRLAARRVLSEGEAYLTGGEGLSSRSLGGALTALGACLEVVLRGPFGERKLRELFAAEEVLQVVQKASA